MARKFNGTSDKIQVNGAQLNGTVQLAADGHLSYSWWVKGSTAVNEYFYSETDLSLGRNIFGLHTFGTGVFGVFIRDNVGNIVYNASGTAIAFDGTWHHVAYVQIGKVAGNTFFKTYVDGVVDLNTFFTLGAIFTVDPTVCTHGCLRLTTDVNFYSGTLGEVATYAVALSDNQIASLAGGLPASHYAPVHYWPMWGDSPEADIGKGWTLTDGPIPSPRTVGTLFGTALANGARVGAGRIPFPGHVG